MPRKTTVTQTRRSSRPTTRRRHALKKFLIGEGVNGPMSADLAMLIDTRLLVQANSGGGKSYAVRRLLEQTHGRVQHIVIDPEGEYASLREKYDYVIAGRGGDTPAEPRTAKLLAERLLKLKASAILDIYELHQNDRVEFVAAFLDAMVNAPKHLWHPVLVVIDEAHKFCPQSGEVVSATSVADLCTRGRKRGYCAVLATQRISKLHKDAAAECNNKLIGRSALDVDMKRSAEELGFSGRDQMLKLRDLAPGEFFTYGPAISRVVQSVRVGPVMTTHPKSGVHRKFKPPPPPKHVKALLSKLADLPEETIYREQNETELRAALMQMRRQLNEAKRAQPTPRPVVVEKDRPVVKERELKRIDKLIAKATPMVNAAAARLAGLATAITEIRTAVLSVRLGRQQSEISENMVADSHKKAAITEQKPSSQAGKKDIPPGERRVLVAIAQHADGAGREQISVMTGFKRSTRDQYIQRLSAAGYVNAKGHTVTATPAGKVALGSDYVPLPTGDALRDYWLRELPPGEGAVLRAVASVFPRPISRERIDAVLGGTLKRSTRDQYIQRLSHRQLVAVDGDGIRASHTLFG